MPLAGVQALARQREMWVQRQVICFGQTVVGRTASGVLAGIVRRCRPEEGTVCRAVRRWKVKPLASKSPQRKAHSVLPTNARYRAASRGNAGEGPGWRLRGIAAAVSVRA